MPFNYTLPLVDDEFTWYVPGDSPTGAAPVNPATGIQLDSVQPFTYDMYIAGGYMSVYSITDLNLTNIPIEFSGEIFITQTDQLTSGRRKIGMLVRVIETNQFYVFHIVIQSVFNFCNIL
jgi:hypothetical protein